MPINTFLSASDPRMAEFCASACREVQDFHRDVVEQGLRQLFAPNGHYDSWDNDGVRPQGGIYRTQDAALLILLGATRPIQCEEFMRGMSQNDTTRNPNGFNSYVKFCMERVVQLLPQARPQYPRRFIIAAHSFGGTIGMALAVVLKAALPDLDISVCTFGSPPPGDLRCRHALTGIDVARWMGAEDSICNLPFDVAQAPIAYRLVTQTVRINFSLQIQAGQGYTLRGDGTFLPQMVLALANPRQELSLVNFMISNDAQVAQEHALNTYVERLRLVVRNLPLTQPDIGAAAQALVAIPAQGQGAAPPNRPALEDQPFPPVPDRPPQVFRESDNPYYRAKTNGKPCVYYQASLIAICKTRRESRLLANSLNTTWRRWMRTRVGDADALQHSVSEAFPS